MVFSLFPVHWIFFPRVWFHSSFSCDHPSKPISWGLVFWEEGEGEEEEEEEEGKSDMAVDINTVM